MSVSYNGFDVKHITFEKKPTTTLNVGDLVITNASGYIEKAIANTSFFGVVTCVRDNFVTVQVSGYAELPYTGSTAPVGMCKLYSNGAGGVTVDSSTGTSNPARKVLKQDSNNKIVGIIL